jgi:ribosomal protein S18 acetylase RimI-like enzyme
MDTTSTPIRNARRGDVPALVLLWAAMMDENARLDPRLAMHAHARDHMASQFGSWMQDSDRILVVAEEGGRVPVGYAAARITDGNGWQLPQTLGEITDCFVISARRRRGTARRMAARLTDLLYERGVSTVRLQVAATNAGSIAFWRSLGWEGLELVLEREATPPVPPSAER